jgi:hypothetical protein
VLQIRAAALGSGGVILVGDPEMLRGLQLTATSGVYCDNHHRESGKIFSAEQ